MPHLAPDPSPAVPHNVPPALSSFVGRSEERVDLARTLAAERLVTVTGPGGAGKTRLAREVAAAFADGHAPEYPDGVWWVELAPVAAGSDVAPDVAPAVAAVLGVRPAPGRDVADAVADALRGSGGHARRTLLVLDNCEHVVEAAAALAEQLLRAVPGLTVLATSREALAVEGEQAWVLPPLATPPAAPGGRPARHAAAAPGASALLDYEAVRLFVERAGAATSAFALTDANAPAVAAICVRLDGLPLALELAAASVGALGVDQVAARLDDAFALLTRGRRTALPKHRTLRALLDWSYARLGDDERVLLARLAVFRAPFTLDAAEALGAGGPGDPVPDGAAAVRALGRLVEQSLVEVREQEGETRFRLLETVRQYGLARLAADPAAERSARARHAAWVEGLVAAAEPHTWSAARGRTVARMARDVDEIRAALDWALAPGSAGGDGAAAAPMTAVRIAAALAWFWFSGVPWDEARARTAAALAAADAAEASGVARTPADQAAVAALLYPISGLAYFAGELQTMLACARRALGLWDAVDAARAGAAASDPVLARAARWGRAVMEQIAGLAYGLLGDAGAALPAMDASVAVAREAGDRWLHAVMLMRRALVRATLGRADEAMADYVDAVPRLRAVGETWFLSLALEGMAAVEMDRGAVAAAAAHARESVAVLRHEPDPWFISRALDTMAGVAAAGAAAAGAASGALPPARAVAVARLMGAAAELRARCGAEVMDIDRGRRAATQAAARAALGDAAFAAAWGEGEALDWDGVFALAASADLAAPPDAPTVAPPNSSPNAAPAPAAGAPALAVHALGPLVVARGGVALAPGELPAGKATELLLFLVLHPEGRTKEQVGLALWPDASAGQLRGSFHVMLHHLRRALGGPDRDAASAWIAYADGRYRLAREPGPGPALDCDVDAVLAAAERLRHAERRQEALDAAELGALARALARRRGPLGEGLAAGDWVVAHQARVRAAWGDGVQALARQHARAGRRDEAAAVLEALVAADPLREGAHRELMVLWAAQGERARALGHYDALAATLRREVGAAPARETQHVVEAIRRAG